MPEMRVYFPGIVPSTLRVEFRSDEAVRLRVAVVGAPTEAVIDLTTDQVDELIETLRQRKCR